jgi:hypothetical protein
LESYEPLAWERLALTEEQVEEHNLGRLAIDKLDHRYKPARSYLAVEAEAIGQQAIVQIVRDRLDQLLPEPLGNQLARQEAQRVRVAATLRNLRS